MINCLSKRNFKESITNSNFFFYNSMFVIDKKVMIIFLFSYPPNNITTDVKLYLFTGNKWTNRTFVSRENMWSSALLAEAQLG